MTKFPNVLIFMTDQQRGAMLDPAHKLKAITPRIDAFAHEATRFRHCYAPSPHCCPSRTSFFTGLYPTEHGVWNNVNGPNALSRGPREGTPFWSTDFAAAGYRLGFTGKWHVSNTTGPAAYGWDDLDAPRPMAPQASSPDTQRHEALKRQTTRLLRSVPSNAEPPRREGEILRKGWPQFRLYDTCEDPFGDAAVVDRARNFIYSTADDCRPWMLYAGTVGPHDPYTPPARFLALYDPEEIELPDSFADDLADKPAMYRRLQDRFNQMSPAEHRRALHHYLAFCSYQDELFGQLLDTLEETNQDRDTVVVYVSDHGDYTAEHGLWTKGLPSFLPAYHVPLILRAPDRLGAGSTTCDQPATLLDIGPTLLDLCGVPSQTAMSGCSLVTELSPGESPGQRDVILASNGNEVYGIQRIVLTDRWKLVVNLFDDDELYDLGADPDEMTNLLYRPHRPRRLGIGPLDMIPSELRAVMQDLYARLWRFALRHGDDIMNPYICTALASYGPLDILQEQGATDRPLSPWLQHGSRGAGA